MGRMTSMLRQSLSAGENSNDRFMAYWQIANGDASRDYSQVFLDFGGACVGPGRWGVAINEWVVSYQFNKVDDTQIDRIRHFLKIKAGDTLILKSGRQYAVAIGEVIEMDNRVYHYSMSFADIDGWDLQHCVRVKWKRLDKDFKRNVFDRRTISQLWDADTIKELEALTAQAPRIKPLHHIHDLSLKPEFSYDQLEAHLIWMGVRISDAENVRHTISRIEKLARWYLGQPHLQAGEHEIRTFLVTPLLEALGWSPQQIRIEKEFGRKKMDLVLYATPFDEEPCMLIETKRMYEGSAGAIEQARWYIDNIPSLAHLQTYCVTDGIRYWRFDKHGEEWLPSAYMNFEMPRVKNLAYPKLHGMYQFLVSLHVSQANRLLTQIELPQNHFILEPEES